MNVRNLVVNIFLEKLVMQGIKIQFKDILSFSTKNLSFFFILKKFLQNSKQVSHTENLNNAAAGSNSSRKCEVLTPFENLCRDSRTSSNLLVCVLLPRRTVTNFQILQEYLDTKMTN